MCYVKSQNIFVNILAHLLGHLRSDALAFYQNLLHKLIFFKVNSVCGAGRDTCNLRHRFKSQGLALSILGLRIAIPKSQGLISEVLSLGVPFPRVPDPRVSGSRVSGFQGLRVLGVRVRVSGLRVPGPGSHVLILDFANEIGCSKRF